MSEFCMPSLGADMDAGTIVEWRVEPGAVVRRGDIIAVIDTEKSTIEIEVFEDGVVEELLVEPGREVPVGTPLARIRAEVVEPAGAPARAAASAEARPGPPSSSRRTEPEPAGEPRNGHRRPATTVSPLVRRLAELEHVDLSTIAGSGVGGAITRHDVERAAASAATVPAAEAKTLPKARHHQFVRGKASPFARRLAAERGIDVRQLVGSGPDGAIVAADVTTAPADEHAAETPPTTPGSPATRSTETPTRTSAADRKALLRASLGALMSRSKREIPHYYLSTTIDLQPAMEWLTSTNESRSISERLLPAVLLLRATTLACHDAPMMNGHWVDGSFRPCDAVHLGVAISLRGGGLVAPAIRDAQDLRVDELMLRLRDLVTRARAGSLRGSEMTDPSITVTNLGDQGVETVQGVIYPPQVALVGFGRIVERPWAVDHMLTVRPVITASLAADHRVSDGHDGARFLSSIDHHLQHPEQL